MVGSHDVRTIYEDNYLLVLDKPPGMVVDKSETQQSQTLEDWLGNYYDTQDVGSSPKVYHSKDLPVRRGIVHRLDKDTSGILLVGKTQEALENLQSQFKSREIKKEYLALVHGLVETGGKVEGNIGRNPKKRGKFTVLGDSPRFAPASTRGAGEAGGKEAVTEYSPEGNFKFSILNFQKVFNDLSKIQMRKLERMKYNEFTLLRCFPRTGRTHQIRVHLKYIGHPIVADKQYAGRKMYRLDYRWCPRQFLHAAKLGFYHPVSGKWMEVESELAEDLGNALKLLSKK